MVSEGPKGPLVFQLKYALSQLTPKSGHWKESSLSGILTGIGRVGKGQTDIIDGWKTVPYTFRGIKNKKFPSPKFPDGISPSPGWSIH